MERHDESLGEVLNRIRTRVYDAGHLCDLIGADEENEPLQGAMAVLTRELAGIADELETAEKAARELEKNEEGEDQEPAPQAVRKRPEIVVDNT